MLINPNPSITWQTHAHPGLPTALFYTPIMNVVNFIRRNINVVNAKNLPLSYLATEPCTERIMLVFTYAFRPSILEQFIQRKFVIHGAIFNKTIYISNVLVERHW